MRRALLALLLVACKGSFSFTDDATPDEDPIVDTDVVDTVDSDAGDTDTDLPLDTDTDVPADTDAPVDSDAPVVDRCDNAADLAELGSVAGSLEQTIQDCTFNCIASRPIGRCVTRCMVANTDLSGGCASCFGEMVGCVTNQCLSDCIDPESQACVDCRDAKCLPGFEECAGVAAP